MQRRRAHRGDSLLTPQEGAADSLKVTMGEFLDWVRVHHYSASTVQTRADALAGFLTWCDARSLSKPAEVTLPILERYQRHLFLYRKKSGKPLGAATQRNRLQVLRTYFKWLTKTGRLAANPASELEMPRQATALPQFVLTPREVEAVLAQPDVATYEGLRDRAMMEVLYSTGIRRAELCELTLFCVSAEGGTVSVVQGKGAKDRVVPIGERAVAWVLKYVEEARPKVVLEPDAGVLFLSVLGLPINPSSLTQLVRDYLQRVGIPRGACHLFRHAMATQMLENGADVRFVQEILGHASLESTQVYTHVSIRKLKEIHAATHPAARLLRSGAEPVKPAVELSREELLAQLEGEAGEEEAPAR